MEWRKVCMWALNSIRRIFVRFRLQLRFSSCSQRRIQKFRGRGRLAADKCISPLVIYPKCTQREKAAWWKKFRANRERAAAPTAPPPPLWIHLCMQSCHVHVCRQMTIFKLPLTHHSAIDTLFFYDNLVAERPDSCSRGLISNSLLIPLVHTNDKWVIHGEDTWICITSIC